MSSELRSSFTNRGLRNAKRYMPSGSTGVFIQVTQAIIFMYLIFISYTLMGVLGVVSVSVLFLLALLSPVIYQVARAFWAKRQAVAPTEIPVADREVKQEG